MNLADILALLGGVAFFLFGMNCMSSGLKKIAGPKMESYLWRLSSTPGKGFSLGILTAAVIQSSSATSVMVVSFVSAGMMTLFQAIPVVLGSNIGTTMTGWILTLSSASSGSESVAAQIFSAVSLLSVFALVGILLQMLAKKNSTRQIGQVLLGLAVLLLAMTQISRAVEPLKESQSFRELLQLFDHPLLATLMGVIVAAAVQSASAGVGIVQALSVTGAISYAAVFPMIIGINIGAAAPVLLSMIGSSRDGKRSSLVYLISNVASGVLAYLYYLILHLAGVAFLQESATVFGIAVMNTAIRVATIPLLLPAYRLLAKIAYRFVPQKEEETADTEEIESLSEQILNYPPAALEKAGAATRKMALLSHQNLLRALTLVDSFDRSVFQTVEEKEHVVDQYEDKISNFVIRIGKNELTLQEQSLVSELLSAVGDFERLSDHAVNLSEVGEELEEKKLSFSPSAQNEIRYLTSAVKEILDLAMRAFLDNRPEEAPRIEALEEVIDEMCKRMRARHIERLQDNECTIVTGFVFSDLLTNLERVSDHCSNIAFSVSHRADLNREEHAFSENLTSSEQFSVLFDEYRKRYIEPIE